LPANGIMIRSDVTEILHFYDFTDLPGEMPIPANLGTFGDFEP